MFGPRVGVKCGIRAGLATGPEDPIAPTSTGATTTMSLTLADSADPVITGGDAFSYTAIVQNTGANTANSVQLVITLDSSLTYVSSSGTGWTIGVVGQVVTCTLASLGSGATANTVTVNVTTGGSGLTASTSAALTGSNFTEVDRTEPTTVNLVTKDATLGWYLPASTTEATNFRARKGLSMTVPVSIWNLSEASGDLADSGAGGITMTATAGGLAYQQTDAALTRKVITFTDAGLGGFKSTSASLPDVSATDCTTVALLKITNPAAVRNVLGHGTTVSKLGATNGNKGRCTSGANTADTTNNITGAWKFFAVQTNHGTSTVLYTDSEKITPIFGSPTGKAVFLGANGASSPTMSAAYMFQVPSTVAAADLKAWLQAMGATITWT